MATLLDYLFVYPDDGILYRASDMILDDHSNAGFNNENKGYSRSGTHIFLSEHDPIPRWNGTILTITQIIKFVMASVAKAELVTLFIATQKLVLLQQKLIKLGWLQPPTLVQTNNTTVVGVVNKILVINKLRSIGLRDYWLQCWETQEQLRFY